MKKWKRIVDNKMRWHGDIDDEKKIIRINKSKKKNEKKGEIIDTIAHEEIHRKHPKMWEKTVGKMAKEYVKKVGFKEKKKMYSKYRKKV
jgi:hypothetical protein